MFIDWNSGTCKVVKESVAISPFLVYLLPAVIILLELTQILYCKSVQNFLKFGMVKLPILNKFCLALVGNVSYGSILGLLLYLFLVCIISATYYEREIDGGAEVAKAMVLATGVFALMNMWMVCYNY